MTPRKKSVDGKLKKNERLRDLWGKKPLCNKMSDRAPHIGSFCFPLCWRCSGGVTGAITTMIFVIKFQPIPRNFLLWIAVCVILCLTALINHTYPPAERKVANALRFVTGIALGTGLYLFVYGIAAWLKNYGGYDVFINSQCYQKIYFVHSHAVCVHLFRATDFNK